MPFFNVHIRITEDIVVLQPADDQPTAEAEAKKKIGSDQVTSYRKTIAVKSALLDPDAIGVP